MKKPRIVAYKKTGSLFEDCFVKENSSDEEPRQTIREMHTDIHELYEFIGAPNPLLEKGHKYGPDVKVAPQLELKKIPKGIPKIKKPRTTSVSASRNKAFKEDPTLRKLKETEESEYEEEDHQSTGNLFTLYPEERTNLVYKRYADQGDWQLDQKNFASYLVDINKVVKAPNKIGGGNDDLNKLVLDPSELRFDSNFESGNLYAVYKVSEKEYDLILQNDINTKGHTQWFYFSVANTRKGASIKFNIINLLKPSSLFNKGMQPVIFSTDQNKKDQSGWFRGGDNISYFKNQINREGTNRNYYTLTFTYTFSHSDDVVYFAHCFPYTLSKLNSFLTEQCTHPVKKRYITRKVLCKTLGGNDCEYLTISSGKTFKSSEKDNRQGIFLTARQHPGESLSSFMMQGIIEFLTSESEEARYLRETCVFKIIPMVNSDGVTHGNYRTSLCGSDLNRKWRAPSKVHQPTVYYTKRLIYELRKTHNLQLFCDFHGHSIKKNAFFYGSTTPENPYPARIFPFILSKLSKYVSFEDSRFTVHNSKESTARVSLWRELQIDNIFTLEASFFGYDNEEGKTVHFTEEDFINIGKDFCLALHKYILQINEKPIVQPSAGNSSSTTPNNRKSSLDDNSERAPNPRKDTTAAVWNTSKLVEELLSNRKLLDVGFKNDDHGSDSDSSEDDIPASVLKKFLPEEPINSGKPPTMKKQKSKAKKPKSKPTSLSEVPGRFDTQPGRAQETEDVPSLTSIKPEIVTTEASIIKDLTTRSNSVSKTPNFRIKNMKKQKQQERFLSDVPPSILYTHYGPDTVNQGTQTDEVSIPLVKNTLSIHINQEYKPLSTQKESKPTFPKFLTNNNGVIAVRNIDPANASFGYMTVFVDQNLNVKSSSMKVTKNITIEITPKKIGKKGMLQVKGAKADMTETKYGVEQHFHLGKYQISRGTGTDFEPLPSEIKFPLHSKRDTSADNNERFRPANLILNSLYGLEENRVPPKNLGKTEETPSFNRFSDLHFHVTPQAQTRRQDNNNSFTAESKTRAATMVSELPIRQKISGRPPKYEENSSATEGLAKKYSQSILENQERPSSNTNFQKLAQRRSSSPVPKLEPIPQNNIYKVKEQQQPSKRRENPPVLQKRLSVSKPFANGENLFYRGYIQGFRQDFNELSRPSTTINEAKTQSSFTKQPGNTASAGLYYNNLKNILGKRSDNFHSGGATSITPNRKTSYQTK